MKTIAIILLLCLTGCASFDLSPRQEEQAARKRWQEQHQLDERGKINEQISVLH